MSQPIRSGVGPASICMCALHKRIVQVLRLHAAQDCSGSTPIAKALPLGNILDASIAYRLGCMSCCSLSIHCIDVHLHRPSPAINLLAGS